ncbi:MAG: class I mannose-6-phosphate isomerase [Chitinispirillales bacterium]|nr:class I mannose-6-phosphate isomerase [Chitinispirillales bacterium]
MSDTFSTPLQFEPIFKEKIWGGRALAEKLGKNIPAGHSIGESWEISAWGNNQTKVCTGKFTGITLGELFSRDPAGLTGHNQKGFPLLFKFIDARENLSIQVHPSAEQSQAHGWGERGKTECWYVVDALKGAQIAAGFNRGNVTPSEASLAVRTGNFGSLVNLIPVKAGDVFFIPPGTVHALLKGVLIYEVQEESDTTLRLYDWNRKTPEGALRELHIDKALEIINFTENIPLKPAPVLLERSENYTYESRCDNPKFFLGQYRFAGSATADLKVIDGFRVISVIEGSASVTAENYSVSLGRGQTILVPAKLNGVKLEGEAGANVLVTMQNK